MKSSKKNRPICQECNKRSRAIAYYRADGSVQYRSMCERCLKEQRESRKPKQREVKPAEPKWAVRGYKKKTVCDSCKFRSQYSSQMHVIFVDGNEDNTELINLRTVCLNCSEASKRHPLFSGRIGGLEPDR